MDEGHNVTEKALSFLSAFTGRILSLSGTPAKPPKKGQLGSAKYYIMEKYFPIVYTYKTDDAVKDGILNDYRIIVHEIPLSQVKNIPNKKGWLNSEQNNYNYWNRMINESDSKEAEYKFKLLRMKALQSYPGKGEYAKKLVLDITEKCLVFCSSQKQADEYPHSYHSKNPKSEENLAKFKSGEIMLLACCEMLSEGITVPDLAQVVIYHTYSGNSPKTKQKLARAMSMIPTKVATVSILVYQKTQDEVWSKSVLEDFDQTKVTYKNNN